MIVFFDLDGTLTDPREGIVNSIQYAADYYGIKTEKQDLLKYIGPPLKDTFKELLGERYTDKLGEEAVSKYRERYANGGIFENGDLAMNLLEAVSQQVSEEKKSSTQWSCVYDQHAVSVDIAMNMNYEKVYTFGL